MKKDFSSLLIKPGIILKSAIKQLDASHRKILFVVDNNCFLIGSLSDGDVRRWILNDGNLEVNVEKVCNNKTYKVTEDYIFDELKNVILTNKFTAVPVVNQEGKIIDVVYWDELFDEEIIPRVKGKELDAPVLIMAGGKGTRLEPFTKILPKPLIPIGDKSIIEIIIDQFLRYNIQHFYVSVNYKSKIIKSYFEELQPTFKIDYVEENIPLGTIGALSLLKGKIKHPIFITNCDIIIKGNYDEFYEFHQNNGFDMSLIASMIHFKIPYGVCEIEQGGKLLSFSEKPEYTYLASTGMYIINPNIIDLIPHNTFFHVTQLMDLVKQKGGKVGVFPVSENSYLDTGEWDEYKKTLERFKI